MVKQKNSKKVFIDKYTELVLNYIKEYDRFLSKIAYEVKTKCPKEEFEDIKQQLIYILFKKKENVRMDLQHMKNSYFSQIAINTAKNYIRTYWEQKNRVHAESISLDSFINYNSEGNDKRFIEYIAEDDDGYYNPEQYYLNNEALSNLKQFASLLTSFEKKVFYLFLDGDTILTISIKCQKSKKTIYNALSRIKDKAKDFFNIAELDNN